MTRANAKLTLLSVCLAACGTIVGADFDDKHEGSTSGGTSSAQGGASSVHGGSTGSGGTSAGATASGGAGMSSGGSSAGGVAAGGAAHGGTTDGGFGGVDGGAGGVGGGSEAGAGGSGGTVSGGRSSGGTSAGGTSAGGTGVGGSSGGTSGSGAGGASGGKAAGGASGGVPTSGGASGGAVSGGSAGSSGSGGSGGAAVVNVVLNEVKAQGSGDDYIEIYNRGTTTAELEGYGVSDSNNLFIFPAGTTLAPNSFLLLLLGQTDLGGTYTCYTPRPCFHASWGVNNDGEVVSFRGRTNQVLDTTTYPAQTGSMGLADDQSWGRYPDGTGVFRANRRTPESTNLLP
ncbi:MAG: lamin tail domain-containing protein [Polyangiaceae bacterium]